MVKLDAIDVKILIALQNDGRMTKVKLAQTVNLSVSPCWERLKRLERAGVVAGYRAEVDIDKLFIPTQVWVEISLQHHRREDFERFEAHIDSIDDVVECWALGGSIDYLMRVVSPHMDGYQLLMEGLLDADIGIDRYVTLVVTKPVKKNVGLPLETLLQEAPKPGG